MKPIVFSQQLPQETGNYFVKCNLNDVRSCALVTVFLENGILKVRRNNQVINLNQSTFASWSQKL